MANERSEFFTKVYRDNLWNGRESRSGQGSDLWYTRPLAEALPGALRTLGVSRLLDLPCGDFNWMKEVDLSGVEYIGGEIVPELVESNNAAFAAPFRKFVELDIVKDILPPADMIFVRDCFIHFSDELIFEALDNIARSDIRYLCMTALDATHYPNVANTDLEPTQHGVSFVYRPIIFEAAPFFFPPPILKLEEGPGGGGGWLTIMGVWEVAAVREVLLRA